VEQPGNPSCTCIRRRPDTEGFSAPSSLHFLPLVFLISLLNRQFQEEHSARILSGFREHPALRELSRRALLQQPACPARRAATHRSSTQPGMRQHAHPQHEEVDDGCPTPSAMALTKNLPHRAPLLHARSPRHRELSQRKPNAPQPSPKSPLHQWSPTSLPGNCPLSMSPQSSPMGTRHLPKPAPRAPPAEGAGWVRCRRRNRGCSCHASRGRRDMSSGLIGY